MSSLNKIFTCVAVCTAAASVHAQTSVTMYGLIDVPIEHLTNTAPSGAGLTRIPGITGSLPSRLGFRGIEDLGGGLNAIFTLEMGFAPDSGALNQGGRAFGRQSFVGLSGPWGSVTLGRQYTALFYAFLDAAVMGPHMFGSASFDPYIPNARVDNSIAYLGRFSGWTVSTTYSLGRDVVNAGPSPAGTNCAGESATDKKACREWSAMVKYDAPTWGGAVVVDEFRGGPGAFGGLTSSDMTDSRKMANGYVKFGALKVGAGLLRRKNGASPTPRSDLAFLGASYKVTDALTVDGELVNYRAKSTSNRANMAVVRATYSLSKRTAVYTTAGRVENEGTFNFAISGAQPGGNPVAGGSQNGVAVGVRHSF